MVRYVVLEEHTLGYIDPAYQDYMGVLHGSVRKGGHDWRNGPVCLMGITPQLRDATAADFDEYMVQVPPGGPGRE